MEINVTLGLALGMSIDPRALIKQVPLPVSSHQGISIQARNGTVYSASVPTRDEIRRDNYARRRMQLTQQGFQTPINEPYQAIGTPICLETKKLLLHSLGQSDEVLMNFVSYRVITLNLPIVLLSLMSG